MPKQSRGFWVCDFCSGTFDSYYDVSTHETYDCTRRLPTNTAQHQQQQQQQHGGHYAAHEDPSARSPAPVASPFMYSGGPVSPPPQQRSFGRRRSLFMGQDNGRLTRDDSIMCRNIEIFEVDVPNTTDSAGAPLALGTVGLRCIHCIGDRTAAPGNANFPGCVADFGDFLREIAEGHLWRCERAPVADKEILRQALHARQQAKKAQGQAWFLQENSRRLLLDYCAFMVRELRLVDKYPPNSGVMFQHGEMGPIHPQHQEQPLHHAARRYPPAQPPLPYPPPQTSSVQTPSTMRDSSEFDQLQFGTPHQFNTPPRREAGDDFSSANYQVSAREQSQQDTFEPFDSIGANFPFICEPSGHWVCKFCQHIHPRYRDDGFQWAATNNRPPPSHFIDHHLSVCRMYQQSLMQDYQSPPTGEPLAARGHPYSFYDQQPPHPGDYHRFPPSPFSLGIAPHGSDSGTPARNVSGVKTPYTRAMAHLDANDFSAKYADGTPVPRHFLLVADDDKLLLTDYYYYLMKQLRHCVFAEADRRTRGGKRDTVEVGYGGLQCVHCAKLPNARKFFWGSVDRLANSFAEIPTHILKCRACPKESQDALLLLKEKHAEQMSRLPRGSQKVYFRRMWRRIHPSPEQQQDFEQQQEIYPEQQHQMAQPTIAEMPTNSSPVISERSRPDKIDPFTTVKLSVAMASSGENEEDSILLERSPIEAARVLVDSALHDGPLSPSSRVLLAIPNDKEWLSDNDIFIRQQIEVFCASREDVEKFQAENKHPVEQGTVGIRCIHCAMSKRGSTEHSTFFPFSITGLYEAVQEIHSLHLSNCTNAPPAVRSKLTSRKGLSSLTSVNRNYYVSAAKCLGLVDTKHGIRASGESTPVSSRAAFSFLETEISGLRASPESDISPARSFTPRKRSLSEPSIPPVEDANANKRTSFKSAGQADMNRILQNPGMNEGSHAGYLCESEKKQGSNAGYPFESEKEQEFSGDRHQYADPSYSTDRPGTESKDLDEEDYGVKREAL